jgi:hypothetical protein
MEKESNKQTAVDFIFSQLPDEYTTTRQGFEVYKQAKEMEKEQIIKACDSGFDDGSSFIEDMKYKNAEEYYAETYGKKFIDLVSDEQSQVHEVVRKLKEKRIK